ncbi:hypothetical protein CPB83DRAFT_263260 [Crepidotus variabilis]|uniref:DUF6533 domain-containing protein n=1 Tax=Crepidotus variabilis TaxID=179855 RepID=A0A9P6EI88_9AGAR|nr:hypothetical protein CPB83DRAFT_263260 [Crepidotus variabilis]
MPGFQSQIPQSELESDLFRSSGGALIVLVWEWAITLDDEIELIWSANRSWLKWNFLFTRYFIIGVQWLVYLNRSLEMAIRYQYHLDQKLVRTWYSIQILTAALAMCSLEVVLMARVYALYGQSKRIFLVLFSLLALEFVVAIMGLAVTLPGHTFTSVNVITRLPTSFAYFGFTALVVQASILVLTIGKYVKGSMYTVPLVRLMARDGTLTFFAVTLFELFVAVYSLYRVEYAVTAYAWLLTIVSASACRLIVNMLRLSTANFESEDAVSEQRTTNLRITTVLTDPIVYETIGTDSSGFSNRTSWNAP